MTKHDYDAIVIGSGLGGSSAAAHLAAIGRSVLLLERYSALGGSSHVFRRQGRWEFDCGVHYVGDCGPDGVTSTLFRGLGLDDCVTWLPLDTDGFDIIAGPDLNLKVPVGWDAYLANLTAAFPGDARAIRRMVGVLRALAAHFDRDQTPVSPARQARWLATSGAAALWASVPVAALMAACGLSPRTTLALSVQCGAMATVATAMTCSTYALFLQDMVGGGAYYPRGGGQQLTAGFADVITSHGGAIRRNAAVEQIMLDGGAVSGVRLDDGEIVRAPAVVSAADIIRTFTDLVGTEHLPARSRRRVSRWTMSRPLINGFFGVELDIDATPNANYFAIPSWEVATSSASLLRFSRRVVSGRGFRDGAEWAREFAAVQPMFVQSSSRRDPDHAAAAPPGHATIEVQTIAPADPALWGYAGHDIATRGYRDSPGYLEVKKIVTEAMLERMEQVLPGSSSMVKVSELGTPATQERYVGNTDGAPFGLETRPSQTLPFRPGVTTQIPGLYLAGTSTAWGPGTTGAMLSGRHAASAISGRDLSAEVRDGAVLADRSRLPSRPAEFDPLFATSSALDATP